MYNDDAPADLLAAERNEAAAILAEGSVVRVVLPSGLVALCETLAEVQAAQRGKIPRDAVRLDRGAT